MMRLLFSHLLNNERNMKCAGTETLVSVLSVHKRKVIYTKGENTMPDTFMGKIMMLVEEYGMSFVRGAGVTMVIALVGTFIG